MNTSKQLLGAEYTRLDPYLGIQKPTVLGGGGLPSNSGVLAYYFAGFGVTGTNQYSLLLKP